jgi:uncharacterized protein YrzB (UPF0473 family)
MTTINDKSGNENFFLKLLEIKKSIKECIQNRGDLTTVQKQHGIKFVKPF